MVAQKLEQKCLKTCKSDYSAWFLIVRPFKYQTLKSLVFRSLKFLAVLFSDSYSTISLCIPKGFFILQVVSSSPPKSVLHWISCTVGIWNLTIQNLRSPLHIETCKKRCTVGIWNLDYFPAFYHQISNLHCSCEFFILNWINIHTYHILGCFTLNHSYN